MIVFPAKSMSGTCVLPKAWPRSILAISIKGAMMSNNFYVKRMKEVEQNVLKKLQS
jgi:hypothetical protein